MPVEYVKLSYAFLVQKLLIAVCDCRLSLMGHLIVDVSDNEMCTVNVIWTCRVRPVSSVLADTGTAFKSEWRSGHITVINVPLCLTAFLQCI